MEKEIGVWSQKNIAIVAIIGLVLIAGSFAGGMAYGKKRATVDRTGLPGQFAGMGVRGAGARQNGGAFAGATAGEVLSKDANGLTVKLRDGGSRIVFMTPSTTVLMATQGTQENLKVGDQITVIGSANTDGSVNAQSVQIRPVDGPGVLGATGKR